MLSAFKNMFKRRNANPKIIDLVYGGEGMVFDPLMVERQMPGDNAAYRYMIAGTNYVMPTPLGGAGTVCSDPISYRDAFPQNRDQYVTTGSYDATVRAGPGTRVDPATPSALFGVKR